MIEGIAKLVFLMGWVFTILAASVAFVLGGYSGIEVISSNGNYMKKKRLSTLKKKAWNLTSKAVRMGAADFAGYCSCVTCGATKPWQELQAGHFIPKAQGNAIYFDRRGIHPQCYRCNINLGSNGPEYFRFMQEKYGDEVIDELRALAKTTIKFTISDYEEMIRELQEELKEIEECGD